MRYALCASLLLCFSAGAFAQEPATVVETEGQEMKQKKQFTHWSVELRGGISNLRGGSRDTNQGGVVSGEFRPAIGIAVEHTFNPLWGISADYMYIDYSNWDFDAVSHEAALIGHVNLSNLLAPNRRAQRVNFYGHLGAGLAFYSYDRQDATLPPLKRSDYTFVMPMGAGVEWNASKTIALNLKTEFRWHSGTRMLGQRPFQPGYAFWQTTAGIRVKFGGARHMKNVTLRAYNHKADSIALQGLLESQLAVWQADMQRQLAAYQTRHQEDVDALNREIAALQRRIDHVRDSICAITAGCDHGLTRIEEIHLTNVEFATASSRVPASYNRYLQALAELLKKHDKWFVTIYGHTDNTGAESLNKDLSADRAASIKEYLIKNGVSEARIITSGFSSKRPVATNETDDGRQRNRRSEITLTVK